MKKQNNNSYNPVIYLVLTSVFCILGLFFVGCHFVMDIMFCLSVIFNFKYIEKTKQKSRFLLTITSGLIVALASFSGLSNLHELIQQNTHTIWLKLSYVLLLSLMIYLSIIIVRCYKYMRAKKS